MPAVKTGMTPPPMPGMPAPMQPMGGPPPAQNPFAPMPPMPLAGMPPPPPPMMPQGGQGQQPMQGATVGRRRRFGDALEGILGRNQGIGAAPQGRPMPMPPQVPQQRMVAPGTPAMRTPPMASRMPRPMEAGGAVRGMQFGGSVPESRFLDAAEVSSPRLGAPDSESFIAMRESSGPDGSVSYAVGAGPDRRVFSDVSNAGEYRQGLETAYREMMSGPTNRVAKSMGDIRRGATLKAIVPEGGGAAQYRVGPIGGGPGTLLFDNDQLDLARDYRSDLFDAGMATRRVDPVVQNFSEGGSVIRQNEDGTYTLESSEGHVATGPSLSVFQRAFPDAEVIDYVAPVVEDTQTTSIPGSTSGAGSATSGGGNFGTGTYTADPVNQSEVNPIDYSQFTGDVGNYAGTAEESALYGPNINIPTSVSQYMTDPVTGGMTTSYGPEMVATSPIGAIKLPARPVSIDIFDFLSTPTYGTMYSGIAPVDTGAVDMFEYDGVTGMRMGGEASRPFTGNSVPRLTDIGGQPHMLAYINPEEERLLQGYRGGAPVVEGPGGVPAYRDFDADMFAGSNYSRDEPERGGDEWSSPTSVTADELANDFSSGDDDNDVDSTFGTGNIFTESSPGASTVDFGRGDDDGGSTGGRDLDADLGIGMSDQTVTAADLASGEGTTTYPTSDGGSVTVATGSTADQAISSGSTAADDLLSTPVTSGPAPVSISPAPTFTDIRGGTHSTKAAADAANRGIIQQGTSYGLGQQEFDRFKDTVADTFTGRDRAETDRMAAAAFPDYASDIGPFQGGIPGLEAGPSYGDIQGIGAAPDVGGLSGVNVGPVADSDIDTSVPAGLADIFGDTLPGGDFDSPINLAAPVGPARDADMDPFGTGTQLSMQDVKDRVSQVEGTADAGGYGRLLGGTEDQFGVDLTGMTVQEVLDFQKARGPGTYADYSQGAVGRIATPAGKYQIVGSTLEDLVNQGVVDPNEPFNEETQERLGSYLIGDRRGLNALQAGDITREEFEANLAREFEGIEKQGLGAGTTADQLGQGLGATIVTPRTTVDQETRNQNLATFKTQLEEQSELSPIENAFFDFAGQLGFGLAKPFADQLRSANQEDRQAIIDQHLNAIASGATPQTDEDGNYIGFDISTMDTFADKVLASDDIMSFMPPDLAASEFTVTEDMIDSLRAAGLNDRADELQVGQTLELSEFSNPSYQADADGDGVPDGERFLQIFDVQSAAAEADPYGMSTEQGIITSDGEEFFVDAGGNLVEVTDDVVPFDPSGGQDVTDVFGDDTAIVGGEGDGPTGPDLGHVDGVCNTEGYIYNPETDMCEPPQEVEETETTPGAGIGSGIPARSFEDVLAGVVVPAPKIAPISANIRPMQAGGMAGLNRAADTFLRALAG